MKIAICASMVFSEQMLSVQKQLVHLGHDATVSIFTTNYVGKNETEREAAILFDKNNRDGIKEFWEQIKTSDAILVLNYDRKGVKNYIGGNTLMEIGFAHVLNKKIYLLNSIPDITYYKSEIEATKPTILNGDLTKID